MLWCTSLIVFHAFLVLLHKYQMVPYYLQLAPFEIIAFVVIAF